MTVVILSHMFPSELDANSGIFVLEQAKALRKLGVRVIVVSPTPWAPRFLRFLASVRKYGVVARRSTVAGFLVERPRVPTLPKKTGFAFSGLLFYLSCRRLFRRLLVRTPIDVIHAHSLLPDGFAAVLLGREFHIPVVGTGHGSDVYLYPRTGKLVGWASRWAARSLAQVITVSNNLRQSALALSGPRSIHVVHNGADEAKFMPSDQVSARMTLGLPLDRKVVTYVGYLRPEKSLEHLLDAFAELASNGAMLCLVGDGPLLPELMSQAERLGILDHCHFAGRRPHDQIPVWLAASDCLVLCSLNEGLPTVLPEAMLSRVPIVATPVGGIPEIIRHQETGLLVPCQDAPAIASAVEALLSDPQLSAAIADRAQADARSSLTWTANARATLLVYEQAVRQHTAALYRRKHPDLRSAA